MSQLRSSIRSYPPEVKQLCLKMYLNGMGLRGIERVTEIHHTTIMDWVREAGLKLPYAPEESEIPEITEIDELQTFIGCRKNKVWVWTVVNHWKPGIILWTVGDRSSSSFHSLWLIIRCWHSFWYVTRTHARSVPCSARSGASAPRWKVYPGFINPEDHLVCKTYMTRVEGENTRLRHCALERTDSLRLANRHTSIARLHRKTLCYSKSLDMLKCSIRLLLHYLRFRTVKTVV